MNDIKFGQWVGEDVDNSGFKSTVVLNIEKRRPEVAQALVHPPTHPHLRTVSVIPLRPFDKEVTYSPSSASFFDMNNGALIPIEQYWKDNNIQEPLPKQTTAVFEEKGRVLRGTFKNDVGRYGTFHLENTANDPVAKADQTLSWAGFKEFVVKTFSNRKLTTIFRGQPDNGYKLRTSFHRHGRNDLLAYLNEDVPNLRHAVNAVSSFYYLDNNGEHLGSLLSLAQHHGFPTPLLDWTFSPYIAAFFAFIEAGNSGHTGDSIRIFVFDFHNWPAEPTPKIIYDPLPSITFHRFSAHNNPRFVPQQSMASFSNIDDMETFIRTRERTTGRRHLTVIDIPKSERRTVIEELDTMGINAGSLFPGLDGVCRALRERFFQY